MPDRSTLERSSATSRASVRGQVLDQANEADGAITVIKAHCAAVDRSKRTTATSSRRRRGRGTYSMTFASFSAVPAAEQQKILATHGKKHEE